MKSSMTTIPTISAHSPWRLACPQRGRPEWWPWQWRGTRRRWLCPWTGHSLPSPSLWQQYPDPSDACLHPRHSGKAGTWWRIVQRRWRSRRACPEGRCPFRWPHHRPWRSRRRRWPWCKIPRGLASAEADVLSQVGHAPCHASPLPSGLPNPRRDQEA